MMDSFVRGNLLGWRDSSLDKKQIKALRVTPLCLFWTLWREKKRRLLNDVEHSNQTIKCDFMYTFQNWVRLYMEDHSMPMIDLVGWMCFK